MIRIFISYIKFNPKTGKFYIGRTSGYLTGKADDFFEYLVKGISTMKKMMTVIFLPI